MTEVQLDKTFLEELKADMECLHSAWQVYRDALASIVLMNHAIACPHVISMAHCTCHVGVSLEAIKRAGAISQGHLDWLGDRREKAAGV